MFRATAFGSVSPSAVRGTVVSNEGSGGGQKKIITTPPIPSTRPKLFSQRHTVMLPAFAANRWSN
jgi:hypothetical protein